MKHLQLLFFFSVILLTGCGSGESGGGSEDRSADQGTPLAPVISQTRFSDPALKACVLQQAEKENWKYLEEFTSLFCEPELSSLEGLQALSHLKDIDLIIPKLSSEDIDVLVALPLAIYERGPEYRFNSGLAEDAIPRIHKMFSWRLPVVEVGDNVTKLLVVVDHNSNESVRDPESLWADFEGFDPIGGIDIGARKVNRHVSLHWVEGYVKEESGHPSQVLLAKASLERVYSDNVSWQAKEPESWGDIYLLPEEVELAGMTGVSNGLLNCVQRLAQEKGWTTNLDVIEIICPFENLTQAGGVEFFPFVERIDFSNNQLSNFYELHNLLRLKSLDIRNNRFSRALHMDGVEILQSGNQFTLQWGENWHIYQSQEQWFVDVPDSVPPADYSLDGSYSYGLYGGSEEGITVLERLESDTALSGELFAKDPVFLSMSGDIEYGVNLPRYLVGEHTSGINCLPTFSGCLSLDGNRLLVKRQVSFSEDAWMLLSLNAPRHELFRVTSDNYKHPIANDGDTVIFMDSEGRFYRMNLAQPGLIELGTMPDEVSGFQHFYLSGNELWGIGAIVDGAPSKQAYRFNINARQWSRLPDLNLMPVNSEVVDTTVAGDSITVRSYQDSTYWKEFWDSQRGQWQYQTSDSRVEWRGEVTLSDGHRYRYSDASAYRPLSPWDWEWDADFVRLPLQIYISEFDAWISLSVPAFELADIGPSGIELSGDTITLRAHYYTQRYSPAIDRQHPYRAILNLDWFPDPALKQCLTDLYGDEPDIAITEIRTLNCDGYGISTDLGLERLVFLEALSLSGNRLDYVGGDTLWQLFFPGSPFGLLALPGLRQLDLSHNRLRRIPNLRTLKRLETLNLTANEITEIRNLPDDVEIILAGNPLRPDPVTYQVEFVDNQWTVQIQDYDPALIYSLYLSESRMQEYPTGEVTDQNRQPVFPLLFADGEQVTIPESQLANINWIAVGAVTFDGAESDVVASQYLLDTGGYWQDMGIDSFGLGDGGVTPYGWFGHESYHEHWLVRQEIAGEITEIRRPEPFYSTGFSIWQNTLYVFGRDAIIQYGIDDERYDYLPPVPTVTSDGEMLATEQGLFYMEPTADDNSPGLLIWQETTNTWRLLHRFNAADGWHYMLSQDGDRVAVGAFSSIEGFRLYSCGPLGCDSEPYLTVDVPAGSDWYPGTLRMQLHGESAYLLGSEVIFRIDFETGEPTVEWEFMASYGSLLRYSGFDGNSFIYSGERECIQGECGVRLFEYTPEVR